MNLDNLLRGLEIKSKVGRFDRLVSSVETDHRKIQSNSLWVCYRGVSIDAHQFMSQAIDKQPIAIVAERMAPSKISPNITYVQVKNSRSALAQIAANWHHWPSEKLNLIGITGTNGKTSTAQFITNIFRSAHLQSAVLGTIGYRLGDTLLPAQSTTPEPILLQNLFTKIHQKKIRKFLYK